MEEPVKGLKFGRVSFAAPHFLPSAMNHRMEKRGGADGSAVEKAFPSTCCFSIDTPKSPAQAMEFLSRSWSPSSSDFFHILSSNRLLLPCCDDDDHQQELDEEVGSKLEVQKGKLQWKKGNSAKREHLWTWMSKGKETLSISSSWTAAEKMKAWLGGAFLAKVSKESRQRRKEELRLQMAEMHAALSVTKLAAAIAGVMVHCSSNSDGPDLAGADSKCITTTTTSGEEGWNMKMSQAVASAAALVATVCAEAAESAGANRTNIASAMSLGLATQSSSDMLALTATAATCLRGAATLKQRAANRGIASEEPHVLAREIQLPIRIPTGHIQIMLVSIYSRHEKLMLNLGKKYLHGAITRHKEYRIIDVIEDFRGGAALTRKVCDLCFLALGTTGGTIQVLFDDEKQCVAWRTSIYNFLSDNQ